MHYTPQTTSNTLTLEETIARLASSETVDGIAMFGSQAGRRASPTSDYDLLVLVGRLPAGIFQMLTHIGGRMADVVFVEIETADQVLDLQEPIPAGSFQGLFLLKMPEAQILYDTSDRLRRVQEKVVREGLEALIQPSTDAAAYAAWFWQNHGLFHMKRMIRSEDPVHLTAVDMMLATGLGGLGRAYFTAHNVPWEGEKSAVRYFHEHDPGFLAQLQACLAETGRKRKLDLYEKLVEKALAPVGALWTPGMTAVTLQDPALPMNHLDLALRFWEDLLKEKQ